MVNLKDTTHCCNVVGSRYGHDKTGRRRTGISCTGIHTYRNGADEGKDLFEIHLIPDSEGERKIIEDVYFDMLVSIIDENVEKTDDYEKRISDTYDIIRY